MPLKLCGLPNVFCLCVEFFFSKLHQKYFRVRPQHFHCETWLLARKSFLQAFHKKINMVYQVTWLVLDFCNGEYFRQRRGLRTAQQLSSMHLTDWNGLLHITLVCLLCLRSCCCFFFCVFFLNILLQTTFELFYMCECFACICGCASHVCLVPLIGKKRY